MERELTLNDDILSGYREDVRTTESKYSLSHPVTPELLTALRCGDHRAYDKVYLNFFGPLVDFLTVLLHDCEEAKEVAQEVFLKVWENRDRIDPSKNIKGFIYTYARNEAFNKLRHNKVRSRYVDARSANPAEFDLSADDQLIGREMGLMIDIALERMPKQQSKVFRMSRDEGLSHDEIAQRLNISKRTVETHIYNAVKSLRELVTLFIILFLTR